MLQCCQTGARLSSGKFFRRTRPWRRVEFARVGTGPVILQLHGGAPGYDQPLALSSSLLVRTVLNASEDLDQDKTRWMLRDAPQSALAYGVLGVLGWVAYAIERHRSRSL